MTVLELARRVKGLGVAELARGLDVHYTLISQVERGHRKAYPKLRLALSSALSIEERKLFNNDESE